MGFFKRTRVFRQKLFIKETGLIDVFKDRKTLIQTGELS
jgi:hypothetical protein